MAGPPLGVSVDVDVNCSNNNNKPSSEENNVIIIRSTDNKNIFSNPKVTDQIISCIKLDKVQCGHVTTICIGRGGAIRVPFKCDYENKDLITKISKIKKAENFNIVCYIPKNRETTQTSGTIYPVDLE